MDTELFIVILYIRSIGIVAIKNITSFFFI